MQIDRRSALGLAAFAVPGLGQAGAAEVRFEHGVASGDPLSDRVVLWTRATPAKAGAALQVAWELAEDAGVKRPVRRGTFTTGPERDYTVKVDVTGLKPGRDYHYRFRAGAAVSSTGRTRTLPTGGLEKAVLAFVNCQLYPGGFYNAYDHLARQERVDAIVHLGDYIYEYGAQDGAYGIEIGRKLGRVPQPAHNLVSLGDYRIRHAQYKADADLQAAHARAPFICVWDDHEFANDCWVGGAENHHPQADGRWLDREAAALRAYYEWMPIREPAPGRAYEAINRSFAFGDLFDLIMVETRMVARSRQLEYGPDGGVPLAVYAAGADGSRRRIDDPEEAERVRAAARAGQPPAGYVIAPDVPALKAILANPERQMMGARQEQWLAETIGASAASGKAWQVLGNQVVMARTRTPDLFKAIGAQRLNGALALFPPAMRGAVQGYLDRSGLDVPFDLDGWDGYPAARERAYAAMKADGAAVIVVSGDSHAFWANELQDEAGRKVAVEFGAGAVSSPANGQDIPSLDLGAIFAAQNPEVKYSNHLAHGYVLLTLTREAATAEFVQVQVDRKPYAGSTLARFRTARPARGAGAPSLERA